MKLKKPHRLRVVLLGVLFLGLSGAVSARLYNLQYVKNDYYTQRADRQHYKRVIIQPERGDIVDRNGRALAQSTGRLTLYINPKFLIPESFRSEEGEVVEPLNLEKFATALAGEIGEEREALLRRLQSQRPTALVKRVRPEIADRLLSVFDTFNVDGRGYWLHRESIRLYPSHVAAPVIGFCTTDEDGDNDGIAGLEFRYDEHLKGTKMEGRSSRSGISETLEPWDPKDLLAARGNTLVLTIDANIQQSVEEILAATVELHSADAAGVVVMDARDGAILAMASYPTFDNNRFASSPPAHMRNRTLTDPLETGSVVKLFTAAMLLDRGSLTPETMIDCEGGFAVVDGRRLRDSPGHRLWVAPFREVLRWSSNVGITKAALVMENQEWYDRLRSFGFGAPTGIDLPGEGSGILYPVERWTKFSRTSLPMGYEIALTPIQIAAGISSIVNGGNYYEPYVVAEVRDPSGNTIERHEPKLVRQVIRPTTSAIMRDLMEDIVDSGTGKKAMIQGYRIGGKTGTTRKSDIFDRAEYIASFAGVIPIHAPRVTIYLYIDAPKGEYYASSVAAPAFNEIARAATLHLGISPTEPIIMDEKGMKNREELALPELPVIYEDFAGAGRMPQFNGMTMAQARTNLPDRIDKVKFLGTGFVSDQFPPAGEPLNENTELVLHFSPEAPMPPAGKNSGVRK